jgi:hypothetical protein
MTELRSALPPAECLRRIEASFDGRIGSSFRPSPPGRVLGRVDGNKVEVVVQGPRFFSMGPKESHSSSRYVARVFNDRDGSIIRGDLDSRTQLVIIPAIWFGLLCFLFIPVGFAAAVGNFSKDPAVILFALVPLAMLPFGALGYRDLLRAAEADAREIEALLARAVGEMVNPADV